MKDLSKYRWNLRILLVETPSKSNPLYRKILETYNKNLQTYHKYYVKLISVVSKTIQEPSIKLIGFDGEIKHTYTKSLNTRKVISDIKKMPMGHYVRPKNMSLYSDYHPRTSTPGLGYKNKSTALKTIKTIKNKNTTYQKQVLTTMIGRAKHHPHQTKNMRNAIAVLSSYKNKLKE